MSKQTTLNEVVDAYIACGNAIGFFHAEMILMKYLPENKPDGKCFDVPKKQRANFFSELKKATERPPSRQGEPA